MTQYFKFLFFLLIALVYQSSFSFKKNTNSSKREVRFPDQELQTSYRELYQQSVILKEAGNTGEALEFSLKALEQAEKSKIAVWIFESSLLVGQIFDQTSSNIKALSYYKKAEHFSQKQPEEVKIFDIYLRIGVSYLKLLKLDSAQYYFDKIITNNSIVVADSIKAISYNNLSGIYFNKQVPDLKKAENMAFQAINFYKKKDNPLFEAAVFSNLIVNLMFQ